MGNFINVDRKNIIDSLVQGYKDRLVSNPFYQYIDKTATITDWFNINTEKSTLDEALKVYESLLGAGSPLKYNRIQNFYVYGIERIQLQIETGDFGLSGDIEGEAIILPNTIIPTPGDFFRITYTDKRYLFKILSVTPDTLENGANFFKVSYKYDKATDESILDQLDGDYSFMINNLGTQFKPLIRSTDYNLIEILDEVSVQLKRYYKRLFFSERVQSFIYNEHGANFYDPFLTEFIIRNKILQDNGEFIYIAQQIYLDPHFALEYDKSMFRSVELRDRDNLSIRTKAIGEYINQPNSLLSIRKESYFRVKQIPLNVNPLVPFVNSFEEELYWKIKTGDLFPGNDIRNIIIKYFKKEMVSKTDINLLDTMDYSVDTSLFYKIPLIIFILEYNIKVLMGMAQISGDIVTSGRNVVVQGEYVEWNEAQW